LFCLFSFSNDDYWIYWWLLKSWEIRLLLHDIRNTSVESTSLLRYFFYIIFSNPLLFTSQLTQDLSANIQIQIQIQIVCETPWISANLHFIYLKLCTRLEHYSWRNYILHTYSLHTSNYIYRVGALFLEELHLQTYSSHTCNYIYRVGVLFLGGTTFYKTRVYILVTIYTGLEHYFGGSTFYKTRVYILVTIYTGLEHYSWRNYILQN